jgi:hypothetical protein
MGERVLDPEEKATFERSYERSKELLDQIYLNVLNWRVHGLEAFQREANVLKGVLMEELNDYVPLPLEISSFSPPPQKGIQGRRPYSPLSMGGVRATKKKGGARRKRSYSR